MPGPPPNLPFDKSKKKGVGDASIITRMKKVSADVQDYQTYRDFTRKTLGATTSSGFIWSALQPGLSYQYNTLFTNIPPVSSGSGGGGGVVPPVGPSQIITSMTTPIVSTGNLRVYWTISQPSNVDVEFYETTTPSATGGTKIGSTVTVSAGTTMANSSSGITTTLGRYYRAQLTPTTVADIPTAVSTCSLYTESYDVFVIMGQSNSVGYGADGIYVGEYSNILDGTVTPGIKQWGRIAPNNGAIINAVDLLQHNDPAVTGTPTQQVGFGYTFAKNYKLQTGRDVLLVPCGKGGSSSGNWASGGSLWTDARDRAIAAVNSKPGNRLCAVLWHQGETDIENSVASATYISNLTNIIDSFRTAITTTAGITPLISPIPWIIGELIPDWLADNSVRPPFNISGTKTTFNADLKQFAESPNNKRAWVPAIAIGDGTGDNAKLLPNNTSQGQYIIHYSAASQRIFGRRYLTAYNAFGGALTAPGAMGAITPSVSQTSVTLSWSAPTGTVTSYLVEYSNDAGVSYLTASYTNGTSFSVTGLISSTSYTFKVTAFNGLIPSIPSTVNATTATAPAPGPMGTITATVSGTSVTLSWSAPTGTVTSYKVEYSDNGGTSYTTSSTNAVSPYSVPGLSAPVTYTFRVTAFNNGSASIPSTVSATTDTFITNGLEFATAPSGSTVALTNAGSRTLTLNSMTTPSFNNSQGVSTRMLRSVSSQYASISGNFPAGSYSKCCWVYFSSNNVQYTNLFSTSAGGNNADTGYHHYLWLAGTGSGGAFPIAASIESGTPSAFPGGLLAAPTTPAVSTWIHIAVTYEQISPTSNSLRLYINGTQVGSKTATVSGGAAANNPGITNANPSIFLGSYFNAANTFNGYLDDVRLYNRALSASEITQIYNRTG